MKEDYLLLAQRVLSGEVTLPTALSRLGTSAEKQKLMRIMRTKNLVGFREKHAKKSFSESDADKIGSKMHISFDKINKDEFVDGLNEELEHKDITHGDPTMTAKIALAHLKEDPKYYTKLDAAMKKSDSVNKSPVGLLRQVKEILFGGTPERRPAHGSVNTRIARENYDAPEFLKVKKPVGDINEIQMQRAGELQKLEEAKGKFGDKTHWSSGERIGVTKETRTHALPQGPNTVGAQNIGRYEVEKSEYISLQDGQSLCKSKWSYKKKSNLPSSSYAYVDEDGEGHLPYKNEKGKVDLPHLRNALARLKQTDISPEAKKQALAKLQGAAKKHGVESEEKLEASIPISNMNINKSIHDHVMEKKAGASQIDHRSINQKFISRYGNVYYNTPVKEEPAREDRKPSFTRWHESWQLK